MWYSDVQIKLVIKEILYSQLESEMLNSMVLSMCQPRYIVMARYDVLPGSHLLPEKSTSNNELSHYVCIFFFLKKRTCQKNKDLFH